MSNRKAVVLLKRANGRRIKPRPMWIPPGDADRLVNDKRAIFISKSLYKAMMGKMERAIMESNIPQTIKTPDGMAITVWETM